MISRPRPTRAELQASANKTVADVIAPGLKILFCGINPGLYTAAVGHHLHAPATVSGPHSIWVVLHPACCPPMKKENFYNTDMESPTWWARATAGADELRPEEYLLGGQELEKKVLQYHPQCLAILGLGAYRSAFRRKQAVIGRQDEKIGEAIVWVLPNPSGLNAHYQINDLGRLFQELRLAVEELKDEER
jgi:double-stranded uracil-DNA glycosylase